MRRVRDNRLVRNIDHQGHDPHGWTTGPRVRCPSSRRPQRMEAHRIRKGSLPHVPVGQEGSGEIARVALSHPAPALGAFPLMAGPAWLAAQCGCGCRSEDCEPGCACPECQPGPGLHITKTSRLDLALGEIVRVTCREWCLVCRDHVIIHAVKLDRGWSNTCERGHDWLSFE